MAVTKNSDETGTPAKKHIKLMFIEQGGDIVCVVTGKQWRYINSGNVSIVAMLLS